jgi:hypothetical protein
MTVRRTAAHTTFAAGSQINSRAIPKINRQFHSTEAR